jgi:isopenicillin N synthase-like dioxygenase
VADLIAAACESWGFFQLIHHGVDEEILRRLTAAMQAFFDLSKAEKAKVSHWPQFKSYARLPHASLTRAPRRRRRRRRRLQVGRSADNSMGWTDAELTKQALDLKEVFDFCYVPHPHLPADHPANRTLDGANRWPSRPQSFKPALDAYFAEMTRCAFKLLQAFCLGLGLPPDALRRLFERGIGFARLNFYEAQPPRGGDSGAAEPPLGIHEHTDAGFLTILLQDEVAGLEVRHQGSWLPVRPVPGALTINVGDMCQVLSNGAFVAPLHRVAAPRERRRYSVPFFFNVRA